MHTGALRTIANEGETDELWRQSFDRMLPEHWRLLVDANGTPADVYDRYVDGSLQMFGSGQYSVVFEGVRKVDQKHVVLKMFRLKSFGSVEGVSNELSVARATAAVREIRALLFVQSLQQREHTDGGVVRLVDYFRATFSDNLRAVIVTGLLPTLMARQTLTETEETALCEMVNSDSGQESIIRESFPELAQSRRPPLLFIETLFAEGETLLDLMRQYGLKSSDFSPLVNLRIATTALEALAFLHEAKLLHGDVSASNVFIQGALEHERAPDGVSSVLIDLGAACRVQHNLSEIGVCNTAGGTPPYMAPEQLQLANSTETRPESVSFERRAAWDVYALGMVLYDWNQGDSRPNELKPNEYNANNLEQRRDVLRDDASRLPKSPFWMGVEHSDHTINSVLFSMLKFEDAARIDARSAATRLQNALRIATAAAEEEQQTPSNRVKRRLSPSNTHSDDSEDNDDDDDDDVESIELNKKKKTSIREAI